MFVRLTIKVTGAARRCSRKRKHEPARPVDRKVRPRYHAHAPLRGRSAVGGIVGLAFGDSHALVKDFGPGFMMLCNRLQADRAASIRLAIRRYLSRVDRTILLIYIGFERGVLPSVIFANVRSSEAKPILGSQDEKVRSGRIRSISEIDKDEKAI